MDRRRVDAAVGLIAAALLMGCDARTPIQPTAPSISQPLPEFSLSGSVRDTAGRTLDGVRVEITSGPRAGTVVTTDAAGQFSMPGTFVGAVTAVASKDGYVSETRTVPLGPVPQPASQQIGRWEIVFYLGPMGPSVDVAGLYTMTLTADVACANLPSEARTRTYTATILFGGRAGFFTGRLSDARFLSTVPCPPGRPPETCTYNLMGIGVAGDYAGINFGIVERLSESTYLVITAGTGGPFGPGGITAPLGGEFLYCASEPYLIDQGTWACPGIGEEQCDSRSHQITLTRR